MVKPAPFVSVDPQVWQDGIHDVRRDYPCHGNTSFVWDANLVPDTYKLGSNQSVAIQASKVHGGGSCQISFTYDRNPKPESLFKVFKSFEGACPGSGDDTADPQEFLLDFRVPANISGGNGTLAWTFFPRLPRAGPLVSMFMICAPVTLENPNQENTGSAVQSGQEAWVALPDMLRANIYNECDTVANADTLFPDPGPDYNQRALGGSVMFAFPTGTSCPT
ncbi:hypothetical protein B0T26DRAFT_653437, partial [Lasiosphaeria miniovina]